MSDNRQLDPNLFEPETKDWIENEKISRPALTYWKDAWLRFKKNKASLLGLIMIFLIILFAIFGPYLSQYGFDDQDLQRRNLPPKIPVLEKVPILGLNGVDMNGIDQYEAKGQDAYFWFGTDELGRDLWTRTWDGTRISLYIAFLAATIDLVIGVIYGGVSGFFGGKIDNILQRIIEILVGIPQLIVVILLILILQPGIISITIAMVITGWVGMARIVRGQILKMKNQEFILASKTLGAKSQRLLLKHLFPNTLGVIVITTMFTIPTAIFTEAFLSFIGLGLQPPTASLGTLVNDGYKLLRTNPHMMFIASGVISIIMISFNLVGDGLRDAFDPKMRR